MYTNWQNQVIHSGESQKKKHRKHTNCRLKFCFENVATTTQNANGLSWPQSTEVIISYYAWNTIMDQLLII